MARPETRKRQRTENELPEETVKPEPNTVPNIETYTRSDIVFDDGNLILLATSTLFRARRGILSAQSPVLKEMFANPPETFSRSKAVPLSG
jgi:hypothetical protein